MFDETKHPCGQPGNAGQFAKSDQSGSTGDKLVDSVRKYSDTPAEDMENMGIKARTVVVKMDTDFQKQLDAATTQKERQNIAFRYIMDNLRGKYTAPDGRTVAIERVGADKMTYQDYKTKLRVCPSLADMIKTGEFKYIQDAQEKQHAKFKQFAYYEVSIQVGDERYSGLLNVGIRADGSSTLYDLKPLFKE